MGSSYTQPSIYSGDRYIFPTATRNFLHTRSLRHLHDTTTWIRRLSNADVHPKSGWASDRSQFHTTSSLRRLLLLHRLELDTCNVNLRACKRQMACPLEDSSGPGLLSLLLSKKFPKPSSHFLIGPCGSRCESGLPSRFVWLFVPYPFR